MVKIEKYIPISFTAIAIAADFIMTNISLPWFGFFNKLKYPMMVIVYSYCIYNYTSLKCSWVSFTEKAALYLYILFSFVASFMDLGEVEMSRIKVQAVNQCGILFANYILAVVVANRGRIEDMLRIFVYLSLFFLIISDITVIFKISPGSNYFIGTKFAIAHHHIKTLAFLLVYIRKWNFRNKLLIAALILETFLINIRAKSAAGLVEITLFVLFIIIYLRKINIIHNPFVQLGTLVACTLFPFWYEWLLSNRFIQFLVQDVLHRKLTLTGRTGIYDMIPLIVGDNFLWGYGVGSNMEICMRWGAINVQNGMLKIFMESGALGALAIYLMFFTVFFRVRKNDDVFLKTFAAYLLVFTALSSIEITIGLATLPFLLYIAVFSDMRRDK